MKLFLVLIVQLFIIACNTSLSHASVATPGFLIIRMPCDTTASMVGSINTKYGETVIFQAITTEGIFQLYANRKSKTFTAGLERNGTFCVALVGGYLEEVVEGTSL